MRYDFYVPETNTYFEITGFSSSSTGWASGNWLKYKNTISKKKDYVENVLLANFEFVQINLTLTEKLFVRDNSI